MAERDDDNFLARWSRRKVQVKQAERSPAPPPAPPPAPEAAVRAETELRPAPLEAQAAPGPEAREAPPAPTLADVAQLTRESDFSRFVAPGVDAGVKNAAMKKLFTDPHFNVMDGLDIYIDDYNKFEPIPKSMLRQMVQARALGLLDDELEPQPAADNAPAHDENPDLQLQPDDAAGRPGADEGTGDSVADAVVEPEPADDPDPHDAVPPRSA